MLKITLKDGSVREVEAGVSVLDFVKQVSNSLAKKVLAAKIDGETKDLTTVLDKDCAVEFLTFEEADGRWALRHTASHILAQAVKRLYKEENVKLAIGPAIDNGFYYDIDMDRQLSEADLKDIEKEMKKIVKENLKLERKEVSRADALKMFEEMGESYKVELINDLPEDALITLYTQGEFTDLCAGPHVLSTGKVKALKLQSVAGAYWRGSEKNKMLQRIYGTAFEKQADLDEYLHMLEEAAKRDKSRLTSMNTCICSKKQPSVTTANWARNLICSACTKKAQASRSSIRTAWLSATSSSTTGAKYIAVMAIRKSRPR